MQKISGFFFSQFCITCIVQGRWNGAFISNISLYLNEILIVTLKCQYCNSNAIVSPLSQCYCNGVSTITILSQQSSLPDNEKSQCVVAQQEHLNCVQAEREFYRNTCTELKNNLERLADTIEFDELHGPCSINTVIHYSFDFAQQIQIASNLMQPGPI